MKGRSAATAPWVVATAAVACAVGILVLGSKRANEGLGEVVRFEATETIFYASAFVAFSLLGALILSRQSGNRIGWVFLGVGAAELFSAFGTEYGVYGLIRHPGSLPAAPEVVWLSDLFGVLGFAAFPLFFLLFPDGRLVSRRWSAVVVAVALAAAMLALHSALVWDLRGADMLRDIEVEDVGWVDYLGETGFPIITFALLAGAVSLVVRFRRGNAEQRQQLRWLAFTAVAFAVLMLLDGIGVLDEGSLLALVLGGLSVVMLPIGAGIAILKYRLYDIDVVINRTLVYGALTAILAGAYLGIVVVLQGLLTPITSDSDIVVAGSTLAVAALFRPMRARVQAFIDRRFYRRKYDAAATLGAFSAQLRDQVDLESLNRELVQVVARTMQPAHASVWLRPAPPTEAAR